MTIELSNVRKKNKGTTECDKSSITCNVDTTQYEDEAMKNEKKKKWTTKYDKSTVKCDVDTAKYDNRTIKCEKKYKKLSNIAKKQSHVMLELYNVMMESSNMRKK